MTKVCRKSEIYRKPSAKQDIGKHLRYNAKSDSNNKRSSQSDDVKNDDGDNETAAGGNVSKKQKQEGDEL